MYVCIYIYIYIYINLYDKAQYVMNIMHIYIYICIYDKMKNVIVQVKSTKNEEDERRFRGSKIFSRRYFEGPDYFLGGTLWVQKCFS